MTLNLTVSGLNVLYRALSGTQIVFTRIKLGNGAEQTLDAVSDLVNPLMSVDITGISIADGAAAIKAPFNNSEVDAGFRMTEVGVFCQNPLDDTQEVLFAYGHEPSETADYIAASSGEIRETDIGFDVFIGNSENVSAIINESAVFASKTDFDAHTSDNGNPHSVTAQQVGLGNVPNVTTNDQTPTYSPAAAPAHLVSGEKLSVAFGKIAAAVSALISHIAHRNNPHAVTAQQVGAAKAAHTHSAADITSGALGVSRGGTGHYTWAPLLLLYASSASQLAQLSRPDVAGKFLTQGTTGSPAWAFPSAVETVEYTGLGSFGADHATVISFSRTPQIVIIAKLGSSAGHMTIFIPYLEKGMTFSDEGTITKVCNHSYGNGKVKFYSTSAEAQANESGKMYRAIAIF